MFLRFLLFYLLNVECAVSLELLDNIDYEIKDIEYFELPNFQRFGNISKNEIEIEELLKLFCSSQNVLKYMFIIVEKINFEMYNPLLSDFSIKFYKDMKTLLTIPEDIEKYFTEENLVYIIWIFESFYCKFNKKAHNSCISRKLRMEYIKKTRKEINFEKLNKFFIIIIKEMKRYGYIGFNNSNTSTPKSSNPTNLPITKSIPAFINKSNSNTSTPKSSNLTNLPITKSIPAFINKSNSNTSTPKSSNPNILPITNSLSAIDIITMKNTVLKSASTTSKNTFKTANTNLKLNKDAFDKIHTLEEFKNNITSKKTSKKFLTASRNNIILNSRSQTQSNLLLN